MSLVLFYRAKKGGLVVLGPRKLVGPGLTCRFWDLPAIFKKYQPILKFTSHFQKIPAELGVYLPFKNTCPISSFTAAFLKNTSQI
ncbi:hypothetical protein [Neobacillus bataviensis]|nr:hypothetical protein [Neobacillus bataviensis]